MARHAAAVRRMRVVSVLGGTAGTLGVIAVLAGVSSLGTASDYAVADQSAVGGAGTTVTSESSLTAGPLDIPRIGVVAPDVDDLGAVAGTAPTRSTAPDPFPSPFPGASASSTVPLPPTLSSFAA